MPARVPAQDEPAAPSTDVRRRLIRAAGELLSQHGAVDPTIQQIAAAAGVSTKTFYQHFPDKESFLTDYWTTQIRYVARRLGQLVSGELEPAERLRLFVEGLYALGDGVPAATGAAIYHARLAATAPERIAVAYVPLFELLAGIVTDAEASGAIPPTDREEVVMPMFQLIVSAVSAALVGSTVAPTPPSPQAVLRTCMEALGLAERAA